MSFFWWVWRRGDSHNFYALWPRFRDQLDLEILNNEKKLEIVLVDQHTLPEKDKCLINSVVEIIDHRPQDPRWLWTGKVINLEIVGSCATLVAKSLVEKNSKSLDPVVCSLLRGKLITYNIFFLWIHCRTGYNDCSKVLSENLSGFQ